MRPIRCHLALTLALCLGAVSLSAQQPEDLTTLPLTFLQNRANDHDAGAEFELGNRYLNGTGVRADKAMAVTWYREAASQGNPEAKSALASLGVAQLRRQDLSNLALPFLQNRAHYHDVSAEFELGYRYQHGVRGVERDNEQAALWYGKAAEQGDQTAKDELAKLNAAPPPTPAQPPAQTAEQQDPLTQLPIAVLERQANAGDSPSQALLGYKYATGEGVPKDEARAVAWFRRAAAQGDRGVTHFRFPTPDADRCFTKTPDAGHPVSIPSQASTRPSRNRRSIAFRASFPAARKCPRATSHRPRRNSNSPIAAK